MRVLLIQYSALPASLGLVGFCFVRMLMFPSDKRRNDLCAAMVALVLPLAALSMLTANLLSAIRTEKYDLYVYRLDALLTGGCQPSFLLGQFLGRHRSLEVLGLIAYSFLPVGIVLVLMAYLWHRPEEDFKPALMTFALNTLLAVPCYLLVPVAGPAFQFPGFPYSFPEAHAALQTTHIAAAPNGIPSVHFSSALLILWFSRHWLAGRVLGFVFLILTGLSTLGSGQHYLVDLIAAVPFAMVVYRLGFKFPLLKDAGVYEKIELREMRRHPRSVA